MHHGRLPRDDEDRGSSPNPHRIPKELPGVVEGHALSESSPAPDPSGLTETSTEREVHDGHHDTIADRSSILIRTQAYRKRNTDMHRPVERNTRRVLF